MENPIAPIKTEIPIPVPGVCTEITVDYVFTAEEQEKKRMVDVAIINLTKKMKERGFDVIISYSDLIFCSYIDDWHDGGTVLCAEYTHVFTQEEFDKINTVFLKDLEEYENFKTQYDRGIEEYEVLFAEFRVKDAQYRGWLDIENKRKLYLESKEMFEPE